MGTLVSEFQSYVDQLTFEPRVYVDANVPVGVVAHMRRRLQWDVLSVVEHEELRRGSDREHSLTWKLRRTLISLDYDFLDDDQFSPLETGGVVVLLLPDELGLIRVLTKIDQFIGGGTPLSEKVVVRAIVHWPEISCLPRMEDRGVRRRPEAVKSLGIIVLQATRFSLGSDSSCFGRNYFPVETLSGRKAYDAGSLKPAASNA